MKLLVWTLMGLALAPSSSSDRKAEAFVGRFGATCIAAYGDIRAFEKSLKTVGFTKKNTSRGNPESITAERGSSEVMTYHGPSPGGPQCSIQSDRITGGDLARLVGEVERQFWVGNPETFRNCSDRPVWRWRTTVKGRNSVLVLVDDRLIGNRNLRLSIHPHSDKKPDCENFRQKVIHESE